MPPIKPVTNLKLFVLSLGPKYCVRPSIATGIMRIIEMNSISRLYGCL